MDEFRLEYILFCHQCVGAMINVPNLVNCLKMDTKIRKRRSIEISKSTKKVRMQ